jgi:hypothetical protein
MIKPLQRLLIPFFGLLIISLSFIPTLTAYRQTTPDHYFSGAHNYPHDYFIYLSHILNSKNGAITTSIKYTSEKQNGTFTLPYYIVGGKVAKIFNLSPSLTYHLMRLCAVLFLLFVSYAWIKEIFKTTFSKNMAFFLLVSSASFPNIVWKETGWEIFPFFNWWTGTDILRSWTFIPHHVLSNALTLLLLLLFVRMLKQDDTRKSVFILSVVSMVFLGLTSPIHLFIVLLTQSIVIFISFIKTKTVNTLFMRKQVILFLVAGITLLYFFVSMQQTPYKELNEWEKNQVISTSIVDYLASIGPTVILGFLGLVTFLIAKKPDKAINVLIVYVIGTLFLLVTGLTKFLGANPIRLVEVSLLLPFAIFSTIFINSLKRISKLVIGIIVVLIILNTYIPFKISLTKEISETPTWAYNLYPDTAFLESLNFLSKNSKPDEIVLIDPAMADHIPAFAGNTVYVDNLITTLNFEKKMEEAKSFYKGEMTTIQAIQWLHEKNIKYIFWGVKEKEYNQDLQKSYSFLKPVFVKNYITIFTVD